VSVRDYAAGLGLGHLPLTDDDTSAELAPGVVLTVEAPSELTFGAVWLSIDDVDLVGDTLADADRVLGRAIAEADARAANLRRALATLLGEAVPA
jgi:hypothetical protein